MGSRVPPTEVFGRQNEEHKRTMRDVRDSLRIDGSQFVKLFEKMQALIAGLTATVVDEVAAAMVGTITPGAIDTAGSIDADGGLTVGGDVSTAGSFITPYGRANPVVTSWVAAAIDGAGRVAVQPSSIQFKHQVEDYDGPGVDDYRVVTYVMIDDPKQTPHIGLIAEEVNHIEPMAVAHEDHEPFALKYDALVGVLIRDAQRSREVIASLTARVEALEAQSQ